MSMKIDHRSACAFEGSAAALQDTAQSNGNRFESEQLARQAGRVLEQLISLDEQYHDLIMSHDRSALEALSACTVVLSRLAQARIGEPETVFDASSGKRSISAGKASSSDRVLP